MSQSLAQIYAHIIFSTRERQPLLQEGYGAFSVSPSHVEALKGYIANHPGTINANHFSRNSGASLRSTGVEYDERYVWD